MILCLIGLYLAKIAVRVSIQVSYVFVFHLQCVESSGKACSSIRIDREVTHLFL